MKDFFKGMLVGSSMLVPGVSGGTMAMLLGIYDKLIWSVAKITKKSLLFLLVFAAGGGIGAMLFAKPLLNLIELYELPMLYFFMGCVFGGAPLIAKSADIRSVSWWQGILWIILGVTTVLAMSLINPERFSLQGSGFFFNLIVGIVLALGLVLPGISVSYLMLLLGIYQSIMAAISSLDIGFLSPLLLGGVLGILLTTKLVKLCLEKHPTPSYLIILGFVLASLFEIFPGFPTSPLQWALCMLLMGAGYVIIGLCQKVSG